MHMDDGRRVPEHPADFEGSFLFKINIYTINVYNIP